MVHVFNYVYYPRALFELTNDQNVQNKSQKWLTHTVSCQPKQARSKQTYTHMCVVWGSLRLPQLYAQFACGWSI